MSGTGTGISDQLYHDTGCACTGGEHDHCFKRQIRENRRYSGSDSDTSGRGDGNGKSDIFQRSFYLSVSNSGNQCKCRHGFYDSGKLRFRKADAAGTASFAASAPSAGNQEGDRVDVGGASVSVAVENSAVAADDKSKDNTLASLTISEGTLSPEFQSKVTEYQAKVGDQVTSLAVSAQPNDAKASVISVSGADKLKTGVNKVQIVVQAENGVKKTYTIQVTRGAAQQESQDTQQKGETQAPADGQQYFTIDETNLYLTKIQ